MLTAADAQGLGIALVAAQKAQVPVTLIDTSDKALSKGIAFAGSSQLRPPFVYTRFADPPQRSCWPRLCPSRASRRSRPTRRVPS